jgi:hypothetical protein
VAGSALLGSMSGALAGVLASPDPDGFPGLAVPGAIVGAITLGLVGLFFNSTGGRADRIARRVKAGLSGIPVVGLLVLLYFSAASEVVLGWTRHTPDGLCAALDPNDPFRQFAVCVPKFGLWALRLLAFDIALLALLFLLQAAQAPHDPPNGSNHARPRRWVVSGSWERSPTCSDAIVNAWRARVLSRLARRCEEGDGPGGRTERDSPVVRVPP